MLDAKRIAFACALATTLAFAVGRYSAISGGPMDRQPTDQQLVEATGGLAPQSEGSMPVNPLVTVEVEKIPTGYTERGTAFPLGHGLWLTARHVAENGCGRIVLIVQGGIVPAQVKFLDPNADIAVLAADAHSDSGLPIERSEISEDESAFAFDFPQGNLGGTEDRLIGRTHLRLGGRLTGVAPVLAWVETKRYPDDIDSLAGISGGPMIDDDVVGIMVAASVRRGRNYSVAPEILRAIEQQLGAEPRQKSVRDVLGKPVALDVAASKLSKSSRIAETYCIPP